jgi:glycosyltransferase involved in cell wall biosynthesis
VKITFVVQRYGAEVVGGAERYVQAMATGMAAAGHEVHVVTSCATSYEDWADVYVPGTTLEEGVTIHRLAVRAPRDNDRFIPLHLRAVDAGAVPLWPWAQERWAQTMGPDLAGAEAVVAALAAASDVTVLVGYHYSQTLRLTGIAAAYGATVVIPTAHPEGAFHVGWVRQMFEHADRVVCLAHEEADLVAAVHGDGRGILVVPCPVEPLSPPAPSLTERTLERFGLQRGRYAVVVGRVDPAKGSDDALRFAGAYRRGVDPDLQLVVVGPGGDPSTAEEGVIATGFVDEPTKDALVAAAGVLVQPSYMESFSLALMEGWLFGRPALVQRRSRVLAGHVRRSGGGLTYGDYRDFEAALATLLGRPALASTLGRRGRDYVLHTFAWDRVLDGFLAALTTASDAGTNRLLGERTPQR